MKLIEYRIMMPLSVEENLIGQLWSFAEVSRLNTGGGEGVEIIENNLFELPLDNNNKLILKNLPEYEDFDSQSNSSSKKSFFKKRLAKKIMTTKKKLN